MDIKLKSFKAESKIKVIKEVRGVTSLGLKEAKELVESAPCTLMTKVKREDALKIVESECLRATMVKPEGQIVLLIRLHPPLHTHPFC